MMSPLLLLFRGQLVFEDCSCHLWNVDDLKSQSICVLISFTHFSSKAKAKGAQRERTAKKEVFLYDGPLVPICKHN